MKKIVLLLLALSMPLLMGAGSSSSSTSSSASSKYDKYFNKGVKAAKRNDFQQAVEWYRRALGERANDANALNNLGFALRKIGMQYMDKAGDAYAKALRAKRDHAQALEYQGELYLWRGELTKANANLDRLKQLGSADAGELEKQLGQVLAQAKMLL